jgi:DNA-binding response OmpR family regulator
MNVLVIGDQTPASDFLLRAMRAEGWSASAAATGRDGLRLARDGGFDVIILDTASPDRQGIEVCRALRDEGRFTPILMLAGCAAAADTVAGLKQGADERLGKPFDLEELLARVEALGRRRGGAQARTAPNRCGPLRFDPVAMRLSLDGEPVALTPRERAIIRLLMTSPGRAFSRERILNAVWRLNEDPLTNIVDVYVARLRRKLGRHGDLIETIRGAGYRLRERADAGDGRR